MASTESPCVCAISHSVSPWPTTTVNGRDVCRGKGGAARVAAGAGGSGRGAAAAAEGEAGAARSREQGGREWRRGGRKCRRRPRRAPGGPGQEEKSDRVGGSTPTGGAESTKPRTSAEETKEQSPQ